MPQNPALPARSGRTGHFANGTSVRRRRRHGRQHQRPQPPLLRTHGPLLGLEKPARRRLHRVEPLSPLFRLRGRFGLLAADGSLGSLLLGIASGPRLRPPFQPLRYRHGPAEDLSLQPRHGLLQVPHRKRPADRTAGDRRKISGLPAGFRPGVLPQQPPLAFQHVRPAARAVRGLLGMAVRYSVRGGAADRDSGRPRAGTRDGVFERTVALGMGPAQPAEDLLQNRSDGQ